MAKRDGKVPLMRHLTKTLGIRNGYLVMAFIVAWHTAETDHTHMHPSTPFDINTYITWWKVERSKAFRDQQMFRQAFPTMSTPSDLVAEMQRQHVESPQQLRWS